MVYRLVTRSKGVVVFAISLIAFGTFGAFLLLLSILMLTLRHLPQLQGLVPESIVAMPLFWASSIINLLIFLSWVVGGIGALHLKDWARQFLRIVMAVHVVNIAVNIFLNVVFAEQVYTRIPVRPLVIGALVSFSYYFGVIYFFSHPDIVRQFRFKSREY